MKSESYQVAADSRQDRTKERNGDAYGHTVTGNGALIAAMVSDGVGSSACDWLASSTACNRFAALLAQATNLGSAPSVAMEEALRQIDWELHSSTVRARGMKCAATAVLWVKDASKVWFANIGDTRLYLADRNGLDQVSEDESQAVVRRGSGGKPLMSGGMVVVQRGITNALGTGNARIVIHSCELAEGAALILCSDGFYDCSPTFERDLLHVLAHQDINEALAALIADYEGQNKDDATVLILRRAYRPLSDPELDHIISHAGDCPLPLHAVATAVNERLPSFVSAGNTDQVRAMLNFLTTNQISLDRTSASNLLQLMSQSRWPDGFTTGIVQSMIRQTIR